jgi:hypothetical protein
VLARCSAHPLSQGAGCVQGLLVGLAATVIKFQSDFRDSPVIIDLAEQRRALAYRVYMFANEARPRRRGALACGRPRCRS